LDRLGVNQKEPLSESTSKYFNLRTLHVDCPVASPNIFIESIPKTLESFYFGPNSNVMGSSNSSLSLPNLRRLDIRGAEVEKDIFARSTLPNLTRLDLFNVVVAGGQLKGLDKCPKLKRITIYGTTLNESTLNEIQARHIEIRDR
jgi:hypothetical protein